MKKETEKEYRLQQYLKLEGGWGALYYCMTTKEREKYFDRLKQEIEQFEKSNG